MQYAQRSFSKLFLALFICVIAALSFQINTTYATTTYKKGYASFNPYYQTKSFYLPKGTYTYKDKAKCKIHPVMGPNSYFVDLYKGNKRIKRILATNCYPQEKSHSAKFTVSSGSYQLRFTKNKNTGYSKDYIYVTSYSISK